MSHFGAGVLQTTFTGKELDSLESGLYYYGARYYQDDWGRFVSVDPVLFKTPFTVIFDPQSLNSYSYVRNSPIILVDPNGETPQEIGWGTLQGLWEGVKETVNAVSAIANNPSLIVTGPADLATQSYNDFKDLSASYKADPEGTSLRIKESFKWFADSVSNLSDEDKGKIIGYSIEKGVEAYLAAKGVQKGLSSSSIKVPSKAYDVLDEIRNNNFKSAPEGYKGGAIWENKPVNGQRLLPEKPEGYYKEWDIDPKIQGARRGSERIVTGQGGEAYYTPDHYDSFIQIN